MTIEDFIETVKTYKDFFKREETIFITRAPGRLDVMGGIADYSGSLVLQLPIADATYVALQETNSTALRITSLGENSEARSIDLDLRIFQNEKNELITYAEARNHFQDQSLHWAAYVAGIFFALMRERKLPLQNGATILIKSSVPEGKGVSSSAAIEVAVMQAANIAFDLNLSCREIALLCQKVENLIAGAPCGIMDQMTTACGEQDELLELLCQPAILKGTVRLPDDLQVWGIDSGVRHSVSGSDYGTVRTAAFMGYRIIAEAANLAVTTLEDDRVCVDDSRWHGYLANITPEEFENEFAQALPESMSGAAFLDRFQGITDTVTRVKRETEYPVLQATRHPVYENARVTAFASLIRNWEANSQPQRLGQLMFESHQSYSDCGLGSSATDLIASLVRDSTEEGLYGARITGGGSGGTVAVLGRSGSTQAIEALRLKFLERTGYLPLLISGSSPGACNFDHVRIQGWFSN